MGSTHRLMQAFLPIVTIIVLSSGAIAEPRIGIASSTYPDAEAIADGNTRTLSAGSEIYANQTVRTGNRGMADLVFTDSTNLSVGPTSEVGLDKFVYDPSGSSSSVVFAARRGAFRFVTGTQVKHAYRVNTPDGSLGVHGTVVEIVVDPKMRRGNQCVTKIRLVEGEADYHVEKTGQNIRLTQPGQVVCISESGNVSYSSSSESILSFSMEQSPPPTYIPGGGGGFTPIQPIPPPIISPTTL
jgi:hypothetical protein